jgi:hypothetical protein
MLTLSGLSLLRKVPFSLSTFKKSCGIPSAPLLSKVGNNYSRSLLIGRIDRSKAIFVACTSAIEFGVLGLKL